MSTEPTSVNSEKGAYSCADADYDGANDAKANFQDIYNTPDPRRYYTTLNRLDYQIPTNAKPVFRKLLHHMQNGRKAKVVDIGCSYGVNAAMLRFDLTFEKLADRYGKQTMQEASVAEAIVTDAEDYARTDATTIAEFIGLDIAQEAVGYAEAVGLIEKAIAEDLETEELSAEGAKAVEGTDLIITTGAVGYVGSQTFKKLIEAASVNGGRPWVAAFVLRQFRFDEIAESLAEYGLATEKLPNKTFIQRRFQNAEEQEGAIEAVRAAGRDPEGLETDGHYHAEFFLARPRAQIDRPLVEMQLA